MDLDRELEVALRSRFSLLCLVSLEEERVVALVRRVCERTQRPLVAWDHANGFELLEGEAALPAAREPIAALEAIERFEAPAVFLLRDFHQCWAGAPRVVRKLRTVAHQLKYTRKTLLVTQPSSLVPDELRDEAVPFEVPPPTAPELGAVLDELAASPGFKVNLDADGRARLVQAAVGLSVAQARRAFSRALVTRGELDARDVALVTAEKGKIVKESGALEFLPAALGVEEVGGLDLLKEWVRRRERAFTAEARAYGLSPPKGIALLGIPGTGKSLAARMIAAMWGLPLLRLDVGALFGSLVGQSEANTRRALALAEAVAPCVLWIDELEKSLATGGSDGGTSLRVLAGLLSWMQERTRPVFVVATANDVSRLPPELLRRGRFDEVFFLDLPTHEERRAIFGVHLRRRERDAAAFDLERLARESHGFVGAEIEQAIVDAMFAAFGEPSGSREVTSSDVSAALAHLVPLSRSQREVIAALRRWLGEGRAQSASFQDRREAVEQSVPIEAPLAEA
jgi:hypothetical protein